MLRRLRPLVMAGVLSAIVFAPALVAPAEHTAPAAAPGCGPDHSVDKQLRAIATASKLVPAKHAGNTRVSYRVPMKLARADASGATFELAAASMPGYHADAFNVAASPKSPSFSNRVYWYTAEMWIDHEYSDTPCTGPDLFGTTSEVFAWRQNTVTGDRVDNSQANFDVWVSLHVSNGAGYSAPWGYHFYDAIRSSSSCIAPTSDRTLADGTKVRGYVRVHVRFFLYPGYTDNYLSQPRSAATQSLTVYQATHSFSDNDRYPGFYSSTSAPSPITAQDDCG